MLTKAERNVTGRVARYLETQRVRQVPWIKVGSLHPAKAHGAAGYHTASEVAGEIESASRHALRGDSTLSNIWNYSPGIEDLHDPAEHFSERAKDILVVSARPTQATGDAYLQAMWHNMARTSVLCSPKVDGPLVIDGSILTRRDKDAGRLTSGRVSTSGGGGISVVLRTLPILRTEGCVLSASDMVRRYKGDQKLNIALQRQRPRALTLGCGCGCADSEVGHCSNAP